MSSSEAAHGLVAGDAPLPADLAGEDHARLASLREKIVHCLMLRFKRSARSWAVRTSPIGSDSMMGKLSPFELVSGIRAEHGGGV